MAQLGALFLPEARLVPAWRPVPDPGGLSPCTASPSGALQLARALPFVQAYNPRQQMRRTGEFRPALKEGGSLCRRQSKLRVPASESRLPLCATAGVP
jgi:hypothetical protein